MRVVHTSVYLDRYGRSPSELVASLGNFRSLLTAAEHHGVTPIVVQAGRVDEVVVHDGLTFHFVKEHWTDGLLRHHPMVRRMSQVIRQVRPDVIHVHGLGMPGHVDMIRRSNPEPMVVQDHANRSPRWWQARAFRQMLSCVDGLLVTADQQLAPFRQRGVIPDHLKVFEVVESSTSFSPGDRDVAAKREGMDGRPNLLWVGRLDRNKDPHVVIRAMKHLFQRLPDARLWCAYGAAPLLHEIQRLVGEDHLLRSRVHLVGLVPQGQIQRMCRAADFFVAASHREGSGYALLEALACGVTPVVTDIPSFRRMTDNGRLGALYSVGDAQSLANAIYRLWTDGSRPSRREIVDYFAKNLSFDAVATGLHRVYTSVRGER